MALHLVSSTPKNQEDAETTALREKKWQNIIEKAENFDKSRKLRFPRKPIESKENRRRINFKKYQPNQNDPNQALTEKRRRKAIESMKIAEQRRIRKIKEQNSIDNLAEELGMMEINENKYLPDGRLKLTKKELHAREMKQARIRQYFMEQENRKKKRFTCFRNPIPANDRSYRLPKKHIPVKTAEIKEEVPTNQFKRYTKDQLRDLCPFGYYYM